MSLFPLWLRIAHFLNIIFIILLIRSGFQILADHPRLYWNDNCTPGSEWIKFTKKKVPKNKLWTSLDDAVHINRILGITGGRHNLGSARRWHFFTVILFFINGLVFISLLFATGLWTSLVPTSWSIFPAAFHTAIQYATFHIPSSASFHPFDPLQQLTYFAVIFIFPLYMLITGLAMSPAIAGRFPRYIKLFRGRQVARSLHFIGVVAIIIFVLGHIALVAIVHPVQNIKSITIGTETGSWTLALLIFASAIAFIILFNIFVTWFTRAHERLVQKSLDPIINIPMKIIGLLPSKQNYTKKDVSPYFWINGHPPKEGDWVKYSKDGFKKWKLKVSGLVENPMELSLANLKKDFNKEVQITKHNCIQGWSGVGQWAGVKVSDIIEKAKPKPEAKYIVFKAFDKDEDGDEYYSAFKISEMMKPQNILAYEMNWQDLPIYHGAPLRLRAESRLGFKMTKWLKSVEFVADLKEVGQGMGSYRGDKEFYDNIASI